MKKKLLILVCFVFAIGTYATVTGVHNSILIQNVLANNTEDQECPDEEVGGGGYLNGPQVPYDCPGAFTGDGYRCTAQIKTNCSQILCR